MKLIRQSSKMRTIVILVLILHYYTVLTTNVVRLDNLDVVVDGTNVTLTLRNGDNGIELLSIIL